MFDPLLTHGMPRDEHDVFYRAMWAPELEETRQQQQFEYLGRLANCEHIARKMSKIFRIDELFDETGEPAMQVCIRLTPWEFHAMRGNADEFAKRIAFDLVERITRGHVWGARDAATRQG